MLPLILGVSRDRDREEGEPAISRRKAVKFWSAGSESNMYCCTVIDFGDVEFPGRSICSAEVTEATPRLNSRLAAN